MCKYSCCWKKVLDRPEQCEIDKIKKIFEAIEDGRLKGFLPSGNFHYSIRYGLHRYVEYINFENRYYIKHFELIPYAG